MAGSDGGGDRGCGFRGVGCGVVVGGPRADHGDHLDPARNRNLDQRLRARAYFCVCGCARACATPRSASAPAQIPLPV